MKLFEQLIKPKSVQSFFENNWTQKELHLKNDFDVKSIFSLDELNSIIKTNQEHLSFPIIRLIKNGKVISESKYTEITTKRRQATSKQISLDKIIKLCESGATLTFNGLNNYSTKLSNFCSNLSEELNEASQINCYLTQKGNQGFEPHYDHHEIFILQVEGEKEWELFGKAEAFPLPTNNHYDQGSPDFNSRRTYNLESGDVFYIPRGMWHQAKANKTSSLHLTLNVICRLNIDFVHWAFDYFAKNEVKFRENLSPIGSIYNPNSMTFIAQYLQTIEKEYSHLRKLFDDYKNQNKELKLPFIN